MTAVAGLVILLGGAALVLLSSPGSRSLFSVTTKYLWADDEANLWAWYSSFLLSLIAMGFGWLAWQADSLSGRRTYWTFAVVALLMSGDEVASVHERFARFAPSLGDLTWSWLVIGVPLAAVVGLVLLRMSRAIPKGLRRDLVIAGAVYLFGALLVEAVGGALYLDLGERSTDLPYVLEVVVEEGLEFLGALLALRAVVAAALIGSRSPRDS